jgi:hypothetical protein
VFAIPKSKTLVKKTAVFSPLPPRISRLTSLHSVVQDPDVTGQLCQNMRSALKTG